MEKEFILNELKKAFPEEYPDKLDKEHIKKWSRRTRLKQLGFLFLETIILLGIGSGNIINNPVKSLQAALGFLCVIVWIFLAINIQKYIRKISFNDKEADEILEIAAKL